MKRIASAHWSGDLKAGQGTVSTASKVLNDTQYSYKTRFENGAGTNPEELLAAAHAGCFTMATALQVGMAGFTATSLDTIATLNLEGTDITGVHLVIVGKIPGMTLQKFTEITKGAEKGCIISKALKVEITSECSLVE